MKIKYKKIPFKPIGSDERQYSSPGFRIPMSVICKSQFHNFDYYHTSLDNLEFVSSDSILQTYLIYINIIENLENLQESQVKPIVKHTQKNPKNSKYPVYETLNPFCEPMLSKRGLYPVLGGALFQPSDFSKNNSYDIELLSTILFYSDSNTTVEQISDKSGFSKSEIEQISEKLVTVNLLKRVR